MKLFGFTLWKQKEDNLYEKINEHWVIRNLKDSIVSLKEEVEILRHTTTPKEYVIVQKESAFIFFSDSGSQKHLQEQRDAAHKKKYRFVYRCPESGREVWVKP